jgi:WD40 repeat protein
VAGKLLHDYQHDGPVSCLDFHPSELLMVSGSADRSLKVIDLDALAPVASAAGEVQPSPSYRVNLPTACQLTSRTHALTCTRTHALLTHSSRTHALTHARTHALIHALTHSLTVASAAGEVETRTLSIIHGRAAA